VIEVNKKKLIYKDSSTRPNKHYLVESDKSETAGVTLRSLYNIIASVSNREELSEWASNYIEFIGLEGSVCEEDLIEMVAFTQKDLPCELDVGLERDDSHTTPLYQQISEYKVDEATSLRVEEDGAVIMYGPDSVSERFSEEEDEADQEDSSKGSTDSRPQKIVREALDDLDAYSRNPEVASFQELVNMPLGLEEEQLHEALEKLESKGEVQETGDGFQLTGGEA